MQSHQPPAKRVEFRPLSLEEWNEIRSIKWTPATRPVLGALFMLNGIGDFETVLESNFSRMRQVNKIFARHGLPYRIRHRRPQTVQHKVWWTAWDCNYYICSIA